MQISFRISVLLLLDLIHSFGLLIRKKNIDVEIYVNESLCDPLHCVLMQLIHHVAEQLWVIGSIDM